MNTQNHQTALQHIQIPIINNPVYQRQLIKIHDNQASSLNTTLLDKEEFAQINDRMPVKVTSWYQALATRSEALRRLVCPSTDELIDISGKDQPPENVLYSPLKGVIHQYPGIIRVAVTNTCSAHCRYCSQHHAISHRKQDSVANLDDVVDYITTFNRFAAADSTQSSSEERAITQVLLSGGDPMVLPNDTLFGMLVRFAESGIDIIRIGTKELSFYPFRFDAAFFATIDAFNSLYPTVLIVLVFQFSHPDELLEIPDQTSLHHLQQRSVHPPVLNAINKFRMRPYLRLLNQSPIIKNINANANDLSTLQIQMNRAGIENHYYFQCREIIGHKAFAVPAEKAMEFFNQSQTYLTGNETKARFVLTTTIGKLEMMGSQSMPSQKASEIVVFRVCRTPRNAKYRNGALIIAKRNEEAFWITDYSNHLLIDETEQLKSMVEKNSI